MLQKAKRPEDWGQREKHPLYGLWNYHKNRNRYGMVPEWAEDFWAFVGGVGGERPSNNHRLRRHEITKPIGPDNFFWDEKYAYGNATKTTRAQRAAYMREYRKRRPRNVKNAELKKLYNLSLDEWEAMYEAQGGVCAICGGREKDKSDRYVNLTVDHCHGTGRVRGLLCNSCNRALGLLQESTDNLRAAIKYLNGQ